jgi:hypothetical protein
MFCDACGAPLQAGQGFCTRCGKAIVGPVPMAQMSRVARHAQPLGILWIAYSAVILIGGGVLMVLANTLFGHLMRNMGPFGPDTNAPNFPTFLQPLLSFIGLALVIKAMAGIAAGVGIIQRADWARTLAIVVACVSLLSMPFGTAIGIYTLWVLFSPEAEAEFRAHSVGV